MGEFSDMVAKGFMCCCGIGCPITLIIILASIKTLAKDEQMVVHYLDGQFAYNGPSTKLYNPFRARDRRFKPRLGPVEYVLIKNTLSGQRRVEEGPLLVNLTAYETHDPPQHKYTLKKDEYIRFVSELTGEERIVLGAGSVAPGPWDNTTGKEQAQSINMDTAVVVLNKMNGSKGLYDVPGMFFPAPYQEVVETVTRTRVLPQECMIVRNAYGRYVVHIGSGSNGTGSGTSFFLKPFEEIVELEWSAFGEPPENGGKQRVGKETLTRIDMKQRRIPFQYDVRTIDNVAMRIEGTIFWMVTDVEKLVGKTADPVGDIWYKARGTLISAISRVNLEDFMASFNTLIQDAFDAQAGESFYSDRGVALDQMEVTKYDPTDPITAVTLQEIIEEATTRINRVQAQEGSNDVEAAKLDNDIKLEEARKLLLEQKALNDLLSASKEGEAEGVQLAESAKSFLLGVDEAIPDETDRLDLYYLRKELENQNQRSALIAQGKATTLFLTPQELHMTMNANEL